MIFSDKTGVDLSLHGDASSFEEGLARTGRNGPDFDRA